MSKERIVKIPCPFCGKESDFLVYDSVNVTLDPELKQKVIDLDIFEFTCEHCHNTKFLPYPCLYHDMERNYKVIEIIKEYYSKLLNGDISSNDASYQERVAQQQRTNLYVNCLKKYSSDVEILSSARRYTKFTTPTIKSLFGILGDGTGGGLSDLVLYEINNRQSSCRLSLLVGPGESQVRSKVLDFFKSNDYFEVGRGVKWTSVYSIDLLVDNDIDDKSVEKLENFLENIIKEIDKILESYK